jgi:acyl-homoserine lactone synthase
LIIGITRSNADQYAAALEQMFRRRYEVFVQRRRWTRLAHQDGQERDQFDTSAAIYLLSLNPFGCVNGGLRLISTLEPHLLSEVFPHTVAGPVPRGPAIYEMTRYFTVPDPADPRRQRQIAGELLCSMLEFCLARGGEWITTMLDTFYVQRMRHNGWKQELIGPPTAYDEGVAVAAKIAVTEQNLQASRAAHGIAGPVLHGVEATAVPRAA